MDFDLPIFLAVNAFARATPWLHEPMLIFTNYGVAVFAALMLIAWWRARGQSDHRVMAAALWAPLGMLAALGINQPIAAMVNETRPYNALSGIVVLANHSKDPSFPSDHAVIAGAVAAGMILVAYRALAWAAALVAVLLAFSRVYVAAHYPHDVLAGLLLGVLVSVGGFMVVRRMMIWFVNAGERTVLRPLFTAAPITTKVV